MSDDQKCFRDGYSTIGAISRVVNTCEEAQRARHASKQMVVLATLDVKIPRALKDNCRVPTYLVRVLSDYLRNRSLTYDTTDEPTTKDVTAGFAQGSIVGPNLWNISYDELLRLEMPVKSQRFSRSLCGWWGLTIQTQDFDAARGILAKVMLRVVRGILSRGLDLAFQKIGVLILIYQRVLRSYW